MKKLSNKLMSIFSLAILIQGWGGWAILRDLYPEKVYTWYPYIPATFFLMGITMISVLSNSYKMEGKKLANVYMMLKLVKMVLAMAYVLSFYFVVGSDLRVFGFVFAAYYAIYIGLETYIFYSVEKQIKKEQ